LFGVSRPFLTKRRDSLSRHDDSCRTARNLFPADARGLTSAKRLVAFKRCSRIFVRGCLSEVREAGLLADGISPRAGTVVVLGSIMALAHGKAQIAVGAESEFLPDEVWLGIEKMLRAPRDSLKELAEAGTQRFRIKRRRSK
jgi:hypothetical protein